jgi:hypothetical protein
VDEGLEDDDDEDVGMYMEAESEQGGDYFWGKEDDYDEYEWLYGLLAGDIVDEDRDRTAIRSPGLTFGVYLISTFYSRAHDAFPSRGAV